MKNLLLLLISVSCLGQVGINTTNPQATLHIAGNARLEVAPASTSDVFLTREPNGDIGSRPMPPTNNSFLTSVENKKEINNGILDITSSTTGYFLSNDIDLGLALTVSVPAGKVGVITLNYQIPMGLLTLESSVNADLGVKFFVDGVEQPEGNSLFSISTISPAPNQGFKHWGRVNVFYHDWIHNTTGSSTITRTYTLKAYVEQYHSANTSTTYRFKRYDLTDNKNRGRAVMNTRKFQFY